MIADKVFVIPELKAVDTNHESPAHRAVLMFADELEQCVYMRHQNTTAFGETYRIPGSERVKPRYDRDFRSFEN